MRPAVAAAYVALYVLLDWVSYIHPVLPLAITPWNPPPGLSLALLLLYGRRYWPALFAAAFVAEVLVRGLPAPLPYALASSLGLAGCYWAVARLLAASGFDPRFRTLGDFTRFVALVFPGTLMAALIYVSIYTFAGVAAGGDFLRNLLRFWVGDMIGVLVTTPLLLAWFRSARPRLTGEGVTQAAGILLALWVIFGIEFTDEFKFFYLLFLPLIWIAMRHGIRGATAGVLGIQLGLISAFLLGGHRAATVVEFQFLMLALAITGLFLGMAVTARRDLEDELNARQAELGRALRMAGAGEMASALAHELNQPLSAIGSYVRACQLLVARPGSDPALLTATMEKAVQEVGRAGEVVHRLRDFFRSGDLRLEQVAVDQLLREGAEPLAGLCARHGIMLRQVVQDRMPPVAADRVQVETVLHNLVSNAVDAIASSGAGQGTIELIAARDGDVLRICVTDSGPGIAPEMRERVFQPFATGKPEGMGLGLAISRSLVEAHGGKLWVEPGPERGARFCFTLPFGL